MNLERAKLIEKKMKLNKEDCPYLRGALCTDGEIAPCSFDWCDDCRYVKEGVGDGK